MILGQAELWQRLVATTEHALRCGALVPIATTFTTLADPCGVQFLVRVAATLRRKDEARAAGAPAADVGKPANPFLPPDPDLTLGPLSDTHTAVLNKLNVVDRHLLLVTRVFEEQEMLLTPADFAALGTCLHAYDALGFYNGGREAGASQPHKHLQVVPLPLAPGLASVPMAVLLPPAAPDTPTLAPALPFVHSYVRLGRESVAPEAFAAKAFTLYGAMLRHAGMPGADPARPRRQAMPYCFLATREWMLLVPRTRESFADVSLNALAFAGSLFVRDPTQLCRLRQSGPMNALRAVTLPR